MKFSYYRLPTGNPVHPWKILPLISITVFSEDRTKFLLGYVLLDSGAEKSLFDLEVAKELDIDLDKAEEEPFSGVEGKRFYVKVKQIPLQVVGDERVLTVPTGFMENLSFLGILGQESFFDAFSITFRRKEFEIELER